MRTLALLFALLVTGLAAPSGAGAQEPGDDITLTGCLAQEVEEEGVEYLLTGVDPALTTAVEVELMAGEGVALGDHVGHTVEVTGVVVGDDDEEADEEEDEEEEGEEEEEAEEEDGQELHIRVTELRHVSGSCGG